jgi:replication factor C subunit 3/5
MVSIQQESIQNNNIWIEKYRPDNFNDIIGQEKNISLLVNLINNNRLPHLLFHGNSGVGKTSTIDAIVDEIYGKNKKFMVMKLDASDDRGINTVRDEIKGFAEKQNILNKGVKLIILDEADSMTYDAQFALRRIIEKYSDNTRFCLICNYENKIIQPIKSRCVNIRFYPLKKIQIYKKLISICNKENVKYTQKGINTIAGICNGDMRKAINILQSVVSNNTQVNSKKCYNISGIIEEKTINKLFLLLIDKTKSINIVYKYIQNNILDEGHCLSLLTELIKIMSINFNKLNETFGNVKTCQIFAKLSDIEKNVANSTFNNIYIIGIICIFKELI